MSDVKRWTSIEIYQAVKTGDDIGLPEELVSIADHDAAMAYLETAYQNQIGKLNETIAARDRELDSLKGKLGIANPYLVKDALIKKQEAELAEAHKRIEELEVELTSRSETARAVNELLLAQRDDCRYRAIVGVTQMTREHYDAELESIAKGGAK